MFLGYSTSVTEDEKAHELADWQTVWLVRLGAWIGNVEKNLKEKGTRWASSEAGHRHVWETADTKEAVDYKYACWFGVRGWRGTRVLTKLRKVLSSAKYVVS